jgi:hypothetical protein
MKSANTTWTWTSLWKRSRRRTSHARPWLRCRLWSYWYRIDCRSILLQGLAVRLINNSHSGIAGSVALYLVAESIRLNRRPLTSTRPNNVCRLPPPLDWGTEWVSSILSVFASISPYSRHVRHCMKGETSTILRGGRVLGCMIMDITV